MSKRELSQIPEAYCLLGALANELGVRGINNLPGCWEYQIDDNWKITVNGHRETMETANGVKIKPYNCYIEFNGWPAGFIAPNGGTIVLGEGVNENAFIAAMKAAIKKASGK